MIISLLATLKLKLVFGKNIKYYLKLILNLNILNSYCVVYKIFIMFKITIIKTLLNTYLSNSYAYIVPMAQ